MCRQRVAIYRTKYVVFSYMRGLKQIASKQDVAVIIYM